MDNLYVLLYLMLTPGGRVFLYSLLSLIGAAGIFYAAAIFMFLPSARTVSINNIPNTAAHVNHRKYDGSWLVEDGDDLYVVYHTADKPSNYIAERIDRSLLMSLPLGHIYFSESLDPTTLEANETQSVQVHPAIVTSTSISFTDDNKNSISVQQHYALS